MTEDYFKFKEIEEPVYSSELYYDFFDGGYIDPFKMLVNEEQARELREARLLIETFLSEAQENGVLEIT